MNRELLKNKKAGFGLLETLIYIALMSFIIGAGVMSAYYLIDASEDGGDTVNTMAEAEFLLRKIDWVLTGTNSISIGGPDSLVVFTNNILPNPIAITLVNNQAMISRGGMMAPEYITGDRVKIENLLFEQLAPSGGKPAGIKTSFTADGKYFESTKYLKY